MPIYWLPIYWLSIYILEENAAKAAAQEAKWIAKAEAEAIAGPDPVAEAEKAKITAQVMEALSKHISPEADAELNAEPEKPDEEPSSQ